jgi:hypothetical protein
MAITGKEHIKPPNVLTASENQKGSSCPSSKNGTIPQQVDKVVNKIVRGLL